MPDGFLNILKPPGMTSHDLVQRVRRLVREKAGHTGTLDPAAAGVLVISLGRATRLSQYVQQLSKSYRAEFTVGITTDTGDAEGTVTDIVLPETLSQDRVQRALDHLVGELTMSPPSYSAARVQGRRAYELAREGHHVRPKARIVQVFGMKLVTFEDGVIPRIVVDVDCSTGTYVRVLAEMLGRQLDAAAYLSVLVRTAVGEFQIVDAITLTELAHDGVENHLLNPSEGLAHMPAVVVDERHLQAVQHGNRIVSSKQYSVGTTVRLIDLTGQLIAVGTCLKENDAIEIQPRTVLPLS
jgi:tRNA pseudouridine55 synthase